MPDEIVQEIEEDTDGNVGRAVVRGVVLGLPASMVLITVAVWLSTDLGLLGSFITALLPGTLLGVFGGGFAGIATTME